MLSTRQIIFSLLTILLLTSACQIASTRQVDAFEDTLIIPSAAATPVAQTRPSPPEGICSLRVDVPAADLPYDLRTEPGGTEGIALLPRGEYLEVVARTADSLASGFLKVRLSDGRGGWLESAMLHAVGGLYGPCEQVPLEADAAAG